MEADHCRLTVRVPGQTPRFLDEQGATGSGPGKVDCAESEEQGDEGSSDQRQRAGKDDLRRTLVTDDDGQHRYSRGCVVVTEGNRQAPEVRRRPQEQHEGFDLNLFDADAVLFESNAAIMGRLNGEVEEVVGQANESKASVVAALSEIAGVVSPMAELGDELKPEEAREAVRKYLIAPLKAIPEKGYSDELAPDATKIIKSLLKYEGGQIGEEVEKRIWEQLREADPALFPAQAQPENHPCGAACRSHEGRCQRRTSEDYCYQHGDTPGAEAQFLVGKWRMSGQQSGIEHSGWEADLALEKSGAAKWHQTKGANAGAKRTGRWQWNRGVFTLVYRAPHTGRVEWQAQVMPASVNAMGGDYRTPEVAPVGLGWGGAWSASRVVA